MVHGSTGRVDTASIMVSQREDVVHRCPVQPAMVLSNDGGLGVSENRKEKLDTDEGDVEFVKDCYHWCVMFPLGRPTALVRWLAMVVQNNC